MTWRERDQHTRSRPALFAPYLEKRLGPARKADEPLEQRHYNLAASMQAALEEVLIAHWTAWRRKTGEKSLCLAGGVAFNCVANGKIFDRTPFERVYVQPAAGDAGLSVGAAFAVEHQVLGRPREFVMSHAGWGPEFSPQEIRHAIEGAGASNGESATRRTRRGLRSSQSTARHIAAGKIVGWFQGRVEWGPRALGNRSILADPRRAEMKDILNRRIKHREIFRPFAPSILEEATGEYFEQTHPSPFMTFAYSVRPEKRSVIPAPTHVDGTARLQTVSRTRESALLEAAARGRRSHRRSRRAEHVVQRQRADRLPPRRSARLFSPHADGRSGDGQLCSREESRRRGCRNKLRGFCRAIEVKLSRRIRSEQQVKSSSLPIAPARDEPES